MFRRPALEARKYKLTGEVILSQPKVMTISCVTLLFVFLIGGFYLTQFEYSRKERVQGYLVPEKGLIKLYSERSGVLDELYVGEGQTVVQGQPLARIRNSQAMIDGEELSRTLEKEVSVQIASLEDELEMSKRVFDEQASDYSRRVDKLKESLLALRSVEATNTERLKIKQTLLEKNEQLHQNGYLSSHALYQVQGEYLELLEINERLERELVLGNIEVARLNSELDLLPHQRKIKEALINRELSELRVRLADLQNQYEFLKLAPEHGMVTAIQPSLGSRVSPQTPILNIIPSDSRLQIELLLPTRSSGFVRIGDKVNIRFDAFPYQKFGIVRGNVVNVDKALILPTQQLLPVKIEEAVYRVRADLESQDMSAYGRSFPLKVGMIADADIVLEERSLLEWLLDPLYAVKGRL